MMRQTIGRAAGAAVLLLALVALPARDAQAQMFGMGYGGYGLGYGGYGLGYGGFGGAYYGGYGFGYPAAAGFGMGYPAYGLGYRGLSYGYPGFGYGNPGFGYGNPGFGYGYGLSPYGGAAITAGAPYINPLFGLGLSPLGVNSALTERNLLGRGRPSYYIRSYAPPVRYR